MTALLWWRVSLFLIAGFCLFWSGAAMASCAEPFGNEGDVLYNAEIANLTYCDGTNWGKLNDSYGVPIGGLVGHWTFGDGSGTTATDSAGSNDGTLEASMTDADWVAGKLGGALDFDGTDDYVSIPSSQWGFPESATIAVWVNPSDLSDDNTIMQYKKTGWEGWHINPKKFIYSGESGSNDVVLGYGAAVAQNEWYQIAIVIDREAGEYRAYIDATLQGTDTIDHPPLSGTGNLYAGARGDVPDQFYDGRIDDVRVYNRALSAAEIQALYDMGNGEPEDPVAHWKFDDGSGTTATDSAGNNDGTLQNGPVWTGGRFGGALDFDGADDYVEIPDSPELDLTTTLSVAAWVYARTIPPASEKVGIISKRSGAEDTWELAMATTTGGFESLFLNIDTGSRHRPGFDPEPNRWYHIVGTWDGSTAKIYADGVERDSVSTTGVMKDLSYPLVFGNMAQLDVNYFDGEIDDVQIYDRALSAAEVQDLYQGACTDPVGRSGDLFYDADSDVVRWCGGGTWHAAGPVPGAGGSGCSDPTGVRGDVFYNVDYMVPVYCDGTYWRPMAGKPDIPTDGLIAYWSFDAGSGTTAKDWSGNGNDGTLTNMDPSSDWVTGKVGSHALDFDGVDDIVGGTGMPNAGSDADVTLSAWIKADTLNINNMWVFSQGRKGSCYNYRMSVGSGGDLQSGNTSSDVSLSGSITTGQWFHITIVYNSSGSIGYINGSFVGSSLKTTSSCNFQGWVISRQTWDTINGGNNGHFDGKIDEVRVYHRALTANEVKALYLNGF